MDPATIATLATSAGTALVLAMVTDAWNVTKSQFARLISRSDGGTEDAVEGELEASRSRLLALAPADQESGRTAEIATWASRFEQILAEPLLLSTISRKQRTW
jgi:hypothetical protein